MTEIGDMHMGKRQARSGVVLSSYFLSPFEEKRGKWKTEEIKIDINGN